MTTNGGTPVTQTANAQNQITGISGATTPTYDANGNMTGDEQGRTLVYDAWNRLVQAKTGSTLLKAYSYDGTNRKVTEDDGTTVTQLVYSAAWQVLEEKVASSYTNRYIWSTVYVDALVMRDDGTQRVWAIQDANWNVTALVDNSGNVVERFGYDDPYGKVTVYDASWNVKSSGSGYAWAVTFQGMRYDEANGNFYQRMRWYSPTLGRWVTVDVLRFKAGDTNLYRPVGNDIANYVDPSGLDPLVLPTIGAGAATAGSTATGGAIATVAAPVAAVTAVAAAGVGVGYVVSDQTGLGDWIGEGIAELIYGEELARNARPRPKPWPVPEPNKFPPLPPIGLTKDTDPNRKRKEFVFRGESPTMSPDIVFNFGIVAKGDNKDLLAHCKTRRADTYYIAALKQYEIAKGYINKHGNGYVYVIYSDRGIDVNKVLGDKSPFPEQDEVVFPFQIHADEVVGAIPYKQFKAGEPIFNK